MNLLKSAFDNKKTYFEFNLNSNSTPTIFIHGVGLDNTMWFPQKKKFKRKSVIYYDLLNHGKSKKDIKILNFRKFNKQLNDLIYYLNLKKLNIVGFSIGALIAQHFATQYPNKIEKLVLIGSIFQRNKKQIYKVKSRFIKSEKGFSISDNSIKRWFNDYYIKKNPNIYNFFFKLLERNKTSDFIPAYKVFVEADKYKLNLNKINMPTLIMTGENEVGSTKLMNQKLHKKIQNSELHIIKSSKHGVTIEKASEINKKISNFLFI